MDKVTHSQCCKSLQMTTMTPGTLLHCIALHCIAFLHFCIFAFLHFCLSFLWTILNLKSFSDYFRLLVTSPDLIMVNGLPEMVTHVKGLYKAFKDEPYKILLGYDTQFELTNGYVCERNNLANMQCVPRWVGCASQIPVTPTQFQGKALSSLSSRYLCAMCIKLLSTDFPKFLMNFSSFTRNYDDFKNCDGLLRWFMSESSSIIMTMPGCLWQTLCQSLRRRRPWECPVCVIVLVYYCFLSLIFRTVKPPCIYVFPDDEFTKLLQKWLRNSQVVKCEIHGKLMLFVSSLPTLQLFQHWKYKLIKLKYLYRVH